MPAVKQKILIVDDDSNIAELISLYLNPETNSAADMAATMEYAFKEPDTSASSTTCPTAMLEPASMVTTS